MSLVTALLFNAPPPSFDGQIRRHFLLDETERRFLSKQEKEPIEFRNIKAAPKKQHKAKTKKAAKDRYQSAFEKLNGQGTTNEIAAIIGIEKRSVISYLMRNDGMLWDCIGRKIPTNRRSPFIWRWKNVTEL